MGWKPCLGAPQEERQMWMCISIHTRANIYILYIWYIYYICVYFINVNNYIYICTLLLHYYYICIDCIDICCCRITATTRPGSSPHRKNCPPSPSWRLPRATGKSWEIHGKTWGNSIQGGFFDGKSTKKCWISRAIHVSLPESMFLAWTACEKPWRIMKYFDHRVTISGPIAFASAEAAPWWGRSM